MQINLYFDTCKLAREFYDHSVYAQRRKEYNDCNVLGFRVRLYNCSMDEVVSLLASKKIYSVYRVVVISEEA